MHPDGFILRESSGVPYYVCSALAQDTSIRHGFSTRRGGVSLAPNGILNLGYVPWDSRDNVDENRRRFLSALGLAPDCLATVAQAHSAEFHIIIGRTHQWNPNTRGDALVTAERGVALAVQVADCFPVLISDSQTGTIAAVHAGWRGALARILLRTLSGMKHKLGVDPARVIVAIGPGIRRCCLEVGPEVAGPFEAAFPRAGLCSPHPNHRGKHLLDIPKALTLQLAEAGVPQEAVYDLGLCTRCHTDEFLSYRAEGSGTGRMMGVICRMSGLSNPI
jgi:YfiH family protein